MARCQLWEERLSINVRKQRNRSVGPERRGRGVVNVDSSFATPVVMRKNIESPNAEEVAKHSEAGKAKESRLPRKLICDGDEERS